MARIQRFFDDLKQKRVACIGTGVSHNDLIALFLKKGISVTICDRKTREQMGETYTQFEAMGANFCLGDAYLDSLTEFDVVFRTPGMYFNHPKLTAAREYGVVITSEMECFFDLCPCKLYAVTGSDGKTTTTTLITELLQKTGRRVHKGGNIGRALLPILEDIDEADAAVVELSSFQLISMRRSPDVAVITNLAPNHLDVHGTMEEYIGSKVNLIAHQNAFSRTVLNLDNAPTNELSGQVRGTLVKFSRQQMPDCGAFLDADGWLCYNAYGTITRVVAATDIRIPGVHNVENYLAAIAAVWGEVTSEQVTEVAKEFGGVEHRIEFIRERRGVRWFNDSIATSPTRVLAGLRAFDQKLIVIAGGYDKKIPFAPMAETVCKRVKTLILMGVTADKIQTAITECDAYDPSELTILRVSSMEAAVACAEECAIPGDVVTLSPACASFDMYPNFEARGLHFKSLVKELPE